MTALSTPDAPSKDRLPSSTQPHLVVRVRGSLLGIPAACVQSMVLMPPVTVLPSRPPALRGVINLRGQVIPLLDLRLQLAMPSYPQEMDELAQLLQAREQDHIHWLAELQASVKERRPFTLARDPHQCKFGKWYDTYRPLNQSVAVLSVWRCFDRPHRRIHAIADTVCRLAAQSASPTPSPSLTRRASRTSWNFAAPSTPCARFSARLPAKSPSSSVISARPLALSVNEVAAAETFPADACQPLPGYLRDSFGVLTSRVACRNSRDLVLLLDLDRLFQCAAA